MPGPGKAKISCIVVFCWLLLTQSAAFAIDIGASETHRRQQLESWGTSLAWFANAVGGWNNEAQRTEVMDLLFDSPNHLGLNFARYNIGAGQSRLLARNFRVGALVPGWVPAAPASITDTSTWQWTWDADPRQRWVLEGAIERGVDRVEAFGLSAPYWMTVSQDTAGGPSSGADNLLTQHYDEYAHYLTEVVKYFHEQEGIRFDSLSPMNEAAAGWWVAGGAQEGMNVARGFNQRLLLETIGQALQAKSLPTGLVAPEETSSVDSIASYNQYNAFTKSFIDQIHTHTYPYGGGNTTQSLTQLKNISQSEGKKLYVSEYGNNSTGGLAGGITLARRITDDLNISQAQGWTYWQAVEPLEYAGAGWGLILADYTGGTNQFQVRKQYHVMRQFTSHIRPGSHILTTSDANTLAAFDPETETTVLVVTNSNASSTTKTFDLTDRAATYGRVIHTTESQDYASTPALSISGTHISRALPATSVTTFVLHHRPNLIQNASFEFDESAPATSDELTGGWRASGAAQFDRAVANAPDDNGGGALMATTPGSSGAIWQEGIGDGETDLTGIAYQFSLDMRLPNSDAGAPIYRADSYLALEFYGADGATLAHESIGDFATSVGALTRDDDYHLFRTPTVVAPDGARFVRPVVRFENSAANSTAIAHLDNAYLQSVHYRPRARQWLSDSNGNAANAHNWSYDTLESHNTHFFFGDVISQQRTVSVDGPLVVTGLTFDSPFTYRLGGIGSIQLGDASQPAMVDVRRGEQKIYSGVTLESDATVQVLHNASLAMNSPVELNGHKLHKQGPGDVSFNSGFSMAGGTLSITAGDSAQIIFGGDTQFDGRLEARFAPGFQPVFGDTFELVDFSSPIDSIFQQVVLPSLEAQMAWKLIYTPQGLAAQIVLQGDFNRDGVVDASDYTMWRDTFGSTTQLVADADRSGVVDNADYDLWKQSFGASIDAFNSSAVASVPEPGAALLLMLGVPSIAFMRRFARTSAPRWSAHCISAETFFSFPIAAFLRYFVSVVLLVFQFLAKHVKSPLRAFLGHYTLNQRARRFCKMLRAFGHQPVNNERGWAAFLDSLFAFQQQAFSRRYGGDGKSAASSHVVLRAVARAYGRTIPCSGKGLTRQSEGEERVSTMSGRYIRSDVASWSAGGLSVSNFFSMWRVLMTSSFGLSSKRTNVRALERRVEMAARLAGLLALILVGQSPALLQGASIVQGNITNGSSTYTTGDGKVTLTPFSKIDPLTPGTLNGFGGGSSAFGVTGGANGSGVDDGDGNPATLGDREALDIGFLAGTGLTNISFTFSRANGTSSGIALTGFTSDPGASVLLDPAPADLSVSYDAGTVLINHEWQGGSISTIGFSNLGASAGQTIRLTTTDLDQAAPQAAIHEIGYDTVPEPASLALAFLGTALLLMKRRQLPDLKV